MCVTERFLYFSKGEHRNVANVQVNDLTFWHVVAV